MEKTTISIIIPAFNEESCIKETIQRLESLSKSENWDYEIIVVSDGSTDKTSQIAKKTGVKVIDHPTNGGYGLSLQHGIEGSKSPLIAITDADGTYPVEELPELVRMVENGFDMAVGARTGNEYRRGLWKYPARIMFKVIAEFVAGRRIPDINSGLRVIKKDKLLPHYKRTCLGFSFTTSITLIFFLNGYFVGYRPISYSKRVGKSKIRHFRDSLRTAQIMVSVISYYNPIKLYLMICMATIIFSMFFITVGLIFNFMLFYIIGIMLFITIPIVFAIGFLAELIRLKNE